MIKKVMISFRIPVKTRREIKQILAGKEMSLQECGIRLFEKFIKENKLRRF